MPTLIQIQSLSKSYGPTRALHNVSFDIAPAEIHALCGENGAGKSTLIKILAGSVSPDTGTILLNNQPLVLGNTRAAEQAGIAVIHQESTAFPHLNAIDNIFVGREIRRTGFAGKFLLDRHQMLIQTNLLLARLGETFSAHTPVGQLPLAQRQMVAIARALSHQCSLLIMDEPTASLSARETDTLFRIIRQLQSEGTSILYVSHRLEEIFSLADRVTILRDGQHISTQPTKDLTKQELIRLMVGRELLTADQIQPELAPELAPGLTPRPATPVLEVKNLSQNKTFKNISFSLYKSEILGLAGLVGAGRSELAHCLFGISAPTSGQILINNQPLPPNNIQASLNAGLALVPEDRQHLGLVLPLSVQQNLSLASLPQITTAGILSNAKESRLASTLIEKIRIKTASPHTPAKNLSGGNQQKLLIAKWLATHPKILILDEPTRGVDIGAKSEIYQLIQQLTATGIAILLISSDLPEILLLSHRILIMRQGQISGELPRHAATQEKILALAMPVAPERVTTGARP